MPPPHDDALTLLRDLGLKATTQRLAILEALMGEREHPTAEEIHEALAKEHPTISRSTVYDTLARFSEEGIVDPLKIGDGITRFEFHNHPHLNIVCVECQRIMDVDSDRIQPFLEDIREETPHEVLDQQVQLRGLCEACAERS